MVHELNYLGLLCVVVTSLLLNEKNAPIHAVSSEAFGLLKATTKVYVGAYCELILACLSHGYPKATSVNNCQNISETSCFEICKTIYADLCSPTNTNFSTADSINKINVLDHNYEFFICISKYKRYI